MAQLNLNWIDRVANTASKRYRTYEIDKRDGGKRTISQPSKSLKSLQRLVIRAVISNFPVHCAATAYRKDFGIRRNAEHHINTRITIRLDLENYFPSFEQDGVRKFFIENIHSNNLSLDQNDIDRIVKIVCKDGHLTIGAPSSPSLTNAMMHDIDSTIHNYCIQKKYIYTRYADDIFISSREWCDTKDVIKFVRTSLSNYKYANLRMNEKKTAILSKKYRRVVTGVVINSNGQLSLGRNRKREIKSRIFSFLNKTMNKTEKEKTQGLIAFAYDIEPLFIQSLYKKYGETEISNILRYRKRK